MSVSIINGRLIDPAHGIDDVLDLHIDGDVVVWSEPGTAAHVVSVLNVLGAGTLGAGDTPVSTDEEEDRCASTTIAIAM